MPQRINKMHLDEVAVEAAGITVSNSTMATGAGIGAIGWLAQINWLGLGGLAIAFAGFLVNWYFVLRKDRRQRRLAEAEERRKDEIHQVQLAALRERCEL